jgi:hypothetical protein
MAGDHIAVLVLLTDGHRPATTDASGCEAVIVEATMFNVTMLVTPISVRSDPNTWAIRANAHLNLG